MRILVTGSAGLIGGEVVEYLGRQGHAMTGIDNNARKDFFGEEGDTSRNLDRVAKSVPGYKHYHMDICDLKSMRYHVFNAKTPAFDAVVHCAAQPSHDKARLDPDLDYKVNVTGTQNMLDAVIQHSPRSVFVFMSTNKIYGETPNRKSFTELPTRYDDPNWEGFDEDTVIDEDNELVFGLHKLEADRTVLRYGQTTPLRAVVLRGGCLTGSGHSGVEMHGFLSYLVRALLDPYRVYRIFGYKGKQVRDNIHAHDVARAVEEIIKGPRKGEAYNIGGGRANSVSVIEAIEMVERISGRIARWEYVDEARVGDHVCWISNTAKLRAHYPNWSITRKLEDIISDLVNDNFGLKVERAWAGIKEEAR